MAVNPKVILKGGADAIRLVPFAKKLLSKLIRNCPSILRKVYKLKGGYAAGGADIVINRITSSNTSPEIRIYAGGAEYFQFLCMPEPMQGIIGWGNGKVVGGSAVQVALPIRVPGALAPAPTGSCYEESSEDLWPYFEPIADQVSLLFRKQGIMQMNGISEFVYFPKGSTKNPSIPLLLSSFRCVQGSIDYFSSFNPAVDGLWTGDQYYDIPPTILAPGEKMAKRRGIDSDWYDRAVLTTGESDNHGTRQFIVMVDASMVFHCFPASSPIIPKAERPPSEYDWENLDAGVDSKYVRTAHLPDDYRIVIPQEASREHVNTYYGSQPADSNAPVIRTIWNFSSDGKRACAVVAKTEEADEDLQWSTVFYRHTGTSLELRNVDLGRTDIDYSIQYTFHSDHETTEDFRLDWPSIVEVEFKITPTGSAIEEFDFSIEIIRQIGKDDGIFPIAAGYASQYDWVKKKPEFETKPDDLIAALLTGSVAQSVKDHWERCGDVGNFEPTKIVLEFRNLENNHSILSTVVQDFPPIYLNAGSFYRELLERPVTGIRTKFSQIDPCNICYTAITTVSEETTDPYIYTATNDYDAENGITYPLVGRYRLSTCSYWIRAVCFGDIIEEKSFGTGAKEAASDITPLDVIIDINDTVRYRPFAFTYQGMPVRGWQSEDPEFNWVAPRQVIYHHDNLLDAIAQAWEDHFDDPPQPFNQATINGIVDDWLNYAEIAAAYPGFENVETHAKDFYWRVAQQIQSDCPDGLPSWINPDPSKQRLALRFFCQLAAESLQQAHAADGASFKTLDALQQKIFPMRFYLGDSGNPEDEIDSFEPQRTFVNMRTFPLPLLAFTFAWKTLLAEYHIYNTCIAHPSGHVSCYSGPHVINPVQHPEMGFLIHENTNFVRGMIPLSDADPVQEDDFSTVYLDTFYAYDGVIKTTHRELYNSAYNRDLSEDSFKDEITYNRFVFSVLNEDYELSSLRVGADLWKGDNFITQNPRAVPRLAANFIR